MSTRARMRMSATKTANVCEQIGATRKTRATNPVSANVFGRFILEREYLSQSLRQRCNYKQKACGTNAT